MHAKKDKRRNTFGGSTVVVNCWRAHLNALISSPYSHMQICRTIISTSGLRRLLGQQDTRLEFKLDKVL